MVCCWSSDPGFVSQRSLNFPKVPPRLALGTTNGPRNGGKDAAAKPPLMILLRCPRASVDHFARKGLPPRLVGSHAIRAARITFRKVGGTAFKTPPAQLWSGFPRDWGGLANFARLSQGGTQSAERLRSQWKHWLHSVRSVA